MSVVYRRFNNKEHESNKQKTDQYKMNVQFEIFDRLYHFYDK